MIIKPLFFCSVIPSCPRQHYVQLSSSSILPSWRRLSPHIRESLDKMCEVPSCSDTFHGPNLSQKTCVSSILWCRLTTCSCVSNLIVIWDVQHAVPVNWNIEPTRQHVRKLDHAVPWDYTSIHTPMGCGKILWPYTDTHTHTSHVSVWTNHWVTQISIDNRW